jgi:peptidoglycan/xylan/chitin deacetylase (PgdA/CDA1 family)
VIPIIPVLLYHSVADRSAHHDRRWTVTRAEFAAHVEVVRASGRVPLLISELAAILRRQRALPDRALALTFDDGFADTYDAVVLLLDRGLPSTVFTTAGEIGLRNRMSASTVAELARLPSIELGAHGCRHRRLDELDRQGVDHEVRDSKACLEDLAQVSVKSFSYPHGLYDREVRDAVIAAGYQSAATVKNAVSHLDDDPFAIARWTVTSRASTSRIAEVLEGRNVPRAWRRERIRTRVFRGIRRQRRQLVAALGMER